VAGLSLKSGMNEQKYRPKLVEYSAEIVNAIGMLTDVVLDVQLAEFDAAAAKIGYENRVGEVCYEYILGSLKNNLVKLVSEDTGIAKEMIVLYWTTGVILLVLVSRIVGEGFRVFLPFSSGSSTRAVQRVVL